MMFKKALLLSLAMALAFMPACAPPKPDPAALQNDPAALAQYILGLINDGEDFAALVEEYSEDPGSIHTGGQYTFPKGMMVPEFEDWAFDPSRNAGDTGIVETQFGYHIMLFEGISGFEEANHREMGASLRDDMYYEKYAAEYELIGSGDWAIHEDLIANTLWGENIAAMAAIAAESGENKVSLTDVTFWYLGAQNNMAYYYAMGGMDLDEIMEGEDGEGIRVMLLEEALENAKEYTVMGNIAERQGFELDPENKEELLSYIEGMVNELGEEAFSDFYKMSSEQFIDTVLRIETAYAFVAEERESIEIPEDKLREIYNQNPGAYNQATVRHILVSGSNDDIDEEAAVG